MTKPLVQTNTRIALDPRKVSFWGSRNSVFNAKELVGFKMTKLLELRKYSMTFEVKVSFWGREIACSRRS